MNRIKAGIAFTLLSSAASWLAQASEISANSAQDMQITSGANTEISFQLTDTESVNARGMILRVHYNSSILSSFAVDQVLAQSHLVTLDPQADVRDHDNDPGTDMFVLMSWADTGVQWPGSSSADLLTLSAASTTDFVGATFIKLSSKTYIDLQPDLVSLKLFTDADSDQIPDDVEIDNQLDPRDADDANEDADGDGLTNLQEYQLGTNMRNSDTDGDGIPDGYENDVEGLDPTVGSDAEGDLDGDGVSNLQEYLDETDPLDATDFKRNLVLYDYDGDGKADVAVRRPSNQFNYILNSADGSITRDEFGLRTTDIPVSGDFDGDGKTDVAVRRASNQFWYVNNSSGVDKITGNDDGITRRTFGLQSADLPVPADYDGDGMTDLAVRRPSNKTWYILNSSGNDNLTGRSDGISRVEFGLQEADLPVPADYDGDGKADIAVRRPSNRHWYILNSSGVDERTGNGDAISRVEFGLQATDIPVPADYDGDGKVDIAVRRPSNQTWYILNSSDGQIQRIVFGRQSGDIPIPADYDGDGKVDVAVRRPSEMRQYILRSSDNEIERITFGLNENDIPLAAPLTTRMNMVNGRDALLIDALLELPEIDIVSHEEFGVEISTEEDANF